MIKQGDLPFQFLNCFNIVSTVHDTAQ